MHIHASFIRNVDKCHTHLLHIYFPTREFILTVCKYWQITVFKMWWALTCLDYQTLLFTYPYVPHAARMNMHQASFSVSIRLIWLFSIYFLCYGWTNIKQCFNISEEISRGTYRRTGWRAKKPKAYQRTVFLEIWLSVCWLISMCFAKTMKIKQTAKY